MDINLYGKNALVCGGSKGIGKASAIQLASMGANVVLVSRNAEMLGQVCSELPNTKEQHHSFLMADPTGHWIYNQLYRH